MNKIRCAFAGVSHAMLADIIHRLAGRNSDIELINNVEERNLPSNIKQLGVNVVMTSLNSNELPEVCNELLEEVPDVAVVGIVEDGRRFCICVDDVGSTGLFELIRAAVEGKWKRKD